MGDLEAKAIFLYGKKDQKLNKMKQIQILIEIENVISSIRISLNR